LIDSNERHVSIAFQVFTPKGKEGEAEIKVKLAGYNEKVIKAANLSDLVYSNND